MVVVRSSDRMSSESAAVVSDPESLTMTAVISTEFTLFYIQDYPFNITSPQHGLYYVSVVLSCLQPST